MTRSSRRASAGVALVSILLVVAVATAVAYQVVVRHSLNVAHSRQTLAGGQARQYALAGEQYARQLLYADWDDEETRGKDTLLEAWVEPEDVFDIDDGELELRIVDLAGRFNLNALGGSESAENLARFQRLLSQLSLDPGAADTWRDWIDDDQQVQDMGAEDSEYLLREPPFRAANQPAVHVSELILATPYSMAELALLRPHVTVLPAPELRVNVNTAGAEVLLALAPGSSPSGVLALAEHPREYDTVEAFVAEFAAFGNSVEALAVTSEFFRVQARAVVDGARSELTAVVHRDHRTGMLTTLSRNYGERIEGSEADAGAGERRAGRA